MNDPGGEPLVFKGIEQVVAGMLESSKTVELCTNALRLEQCLDWFEPSPRMTFVVHLDGMREIHDYICDYPGLWDVAVDAIRKFATAAPEGVKRSSGSSTRLPTTVMTVSPAMWVS